MEPATRQRRRGPGRTLVPVVQERGEGVRMWRSSSDLHESAASSEGRGGGGTLCSRVETLTGGFHLSGAAGTKLEAPAELRSLRSLRSLEVVSQQSYSETSECEAVSLKTRPIKNVFLVFLPCSSEDRGYVILK